MLKRGSEATVAGMDMDMPPHPVRCVSPLLATSKGFPKIRDMSPELRAG